MINVKNKKGNAVVISLTTLVLVVVIIFSISGIYINKLYSLKNIEKYYDQEIKNLLTKEPKEKQQDKENKDK